MSLRDDQITAKNYKNFYEGIKDHFDVSAPVGDFRDVGGGYIPVGTILMIMRKFVDTVSDPQLGAFGFNTCSGDEFMISEKYQLAKFFEDQYGSMNYFGGDGITTFCVPDLRGEFLIGTGTSKYTYQGSGPAVGGHLDASELNVGFVHKGSGGFSLPEAPSSTYIAFFGRKGHSAVTISPRKGSAGGAAHKQVANTSSTAYMYGIRPTNTSVNFVIATKDIYVNCLNDYSLDELSIGKWYDGKPLYQRSFIIKGQIITGGSFCTLGMIPNLDIGFVESGYYISLDPEDEGAVVPINHCVPDQTSTTKCVNCFIDSVSGQVVCDIGDDVSCIEIVCQVRYTKATD